MFEKSMQNSFKRSIAILLIIALVFSMCAPSAFALGEQWQGTAEGDVLIKDTVTKIADNVYEHEVITNNKEGNRQKIDYLCEIGKSDTIKVAAGYGQNDASSWTLLETTRQAAAYERSHPGETVVAAINADFFNMATGQPQGALVMEGKVYNNANNRPYFGITKDGKAVIRQDNNLSDLETAVGGDVILIDNGKPIDKNTEYGALKYSRTAIGIKADGTIVTFVTYGLNPPTSCGRSYKDIAQMLVNEGCVYALALDGGGSSTFAARPEGTDKLEVRNTPNDGAERQVSSSLLFISTAEPTGVFSHAQLTPNNEIYTPGSSVQFEAKGVDTAGIGMELPEGVKYALADDSKALGTIDENTGAFTAGQDTGVVTVNMIYENKVVGETKIEIAVPDNIYFGTDEVSLGFEEKSDLGIVVRSKGRDVNYKAGDIKWTISDDRMGHFEGNSFISADGVSLTGEATATSAFDENVFGKIKVIVGKLPTIVWDFEDVENEDGKITLAEDYYIGNESTKGILSTSNYGRGGKESIEIVSSDMDEPVRFGNKSLKLNYDFRNCGEVTEGACIGTTDEFVVPGVPTGIGVWVYAPEGVGIQWQGEGSQAGFWLRGYVNDGTGTQKPYDFTLEPKVVSGDQQPGIYWEGWKYLEADLTNLQAPFKIKPGMTFRLMFVAGTKMGTRTANSIYFDNFQFVYGANVDDIDEPYVASMQLNGAELENDMVVKTDTVTIDSMLKDKDGKYATGIDDRTVRMYIDGINVVDNDKYMYAYSDGDDRAQLSDVKLKDGKHSITVKAKDGFGNEVNETRYFTVDTGSQNEGTSVSIIPATEKAVIGKTIDLQIVASDDTVTQSTTIFKLGNQFKDYKVKFSDNYEGTAKYNKLEKTITIDAKRKEAASPLSLWDRFTGNTETVIATLSVDVPVNLKDTDSFTYTVKGGKFETEKGEYNTYSDVEKKVAVGADYQISLDTVILGGKAAEITVKDSAGKPVASVPLYMSQDNSLIGETDEIGVLKTDKFNKEGLTASDYVIYAKDKNGGLSFEYKLSVFAPQGELNGMPYNVRFNTVEKLASQKNITWFSNPLNDKKQTIKYRESGSQEWKTADAKTQQVDFNTSGNYIVNVNAVNLEGLKADTTYEYVLGTDEAVLEAATFKTGQEGKKTNEFFIIGDIQDPDKSRVEEVASQLDAKNHNYDFGITIGDAIDQASNYTDWSDLGQVLGADMLGGTNMLNIMGNHEYYGDSSAATASAIYNNPNTKEGGYYSFEYNDVYVAVINFSNTASPIKEAADWLVKDAEKSNATWKILCMHQPPYYTNNGGNEPVYESIPDAAEKAGIDAVFSGHDHSWAVTNPLIDDKIDEENGIVYYIVGAAGSKRYTASTQDKFDYKTIFKKVGEPFTATYLKVSSDQDEMTINVYDTKAGLLDTVVLKSECKKNGHVHVYDAEKNQVVCSVCGRVIENYSGWVTDGSGNNNMYFINGKYRTGWNQLGEDVYYFNSKGLQQEVTLKTDIKTDCTVRGYRIFECKTAPESEREYKVRYQMAGGHEYEEVNGVYTCTVCGHERINLSDCDIIFAKDFTYTGKPILPIVKVVAKKDGKEITLKNGVDYYYNIEKDRTNVGDVKITVTAQKVGIFVDVNEWRGNCAGEVVATYTIHPELPRKATVINNKTSATLNWQTSESAEEYVIYQSVNGGAYEEIATASGNTYVVTGMDKNKNYKFRIGTRATDDGKVINSIRKLIPAVETAELTIENRKADGKPVIRMKNWNDNAKYEVYRSTSLDEASFELLGLMDKNEYADVKAEPGQLYYYRVKVTNADGETKLTTLYAATAGCAQPDVKVSANDTDGKPIISWGEVPAAGTYEVYRSDNGVNGSYKLIWNGASTKFEDKDAKYGMTYYYKVKALSATGIESEFSNTIAYNCQLFKPVLEKAELNDSNKPVLKWNKVEGAEEYKVYRAASADGKYTEIAAVKDITYTDSKAVDGTAYYYKVAALADGTEAMSDAISITCPLGEPVIEKVQLNDNGKPYIVWNNVEGALKYKIYRADNKDADYVEIAETEKTAYTDENVTAGNIYFYKVEAVGNNASAESKPASVTCLLEIPSVESTLNENGKPVIKWSNVSGAVMYEVYRAASQDGEYLKIAEVSGNEHADIEAAESTTYYYKVRAIGNNTQVFAESKAVTVTSGNEPIVPYRVDGKNRFETAISSADMLKKLYGIEKFDTIIVASGDSYADALAGSYLAKTKKAPILLVNNFVEPLVKEYIDNNLNSGGTVYILGGEGVVSKRFEDSVSGCNVKRLGGYDRFETNLNILKEAGVNAEDILVCSSESFADSLSAASTGKPVLLVDRNLKASQKEYLESLGDRTYYMIGGTAVVSEEVEKELAAYGTTDRIAGANRFATSKAITDKFFYEGSDALIIASGDDFPDGLTGGAVALAKQAPIILVNDMNIAGAKAYAERFGINQLIIIGGNGAVSDSIVENIIK